MTQTQTEVHTHHAADRTVVFALASGGLAWSIFVLWILVMKLMEIVRG
jgi:hypothetical protein